MSMKTKKIYILNNGVENLFQKSQINKPKRRKSIKSIMSHLGSKIYAWCMAL